jgi:hypothetical protein
MTASNDDIFLPGMCRRLSVQELDKARRICADSVGSVAQRAPYIESNAVDRAFALPDANWSYEAPNDFVKLFLRVSAGDPDTLQHLRAFCQVFSGYNLYSMCNGAGSTSADRIIAPNIDTEVAELLAVRNPTYVSDWLAMTQGLPLRYRFSPPHQLGECGHLVEGVIVNHDTVTYQERVNLVYESGLADWLDRRSARSGEIRICEIGGGYGALAHWFKGAFPNCSYTIVDLPESILFSRLWLSLARPDLASSFGLEPAPFGLRFVPNYMAGRLEDSFDLVINTLSMSEMSQHQVETYVDLMTKTWLTDGGLFFEQNQDNRHMGLICAQDIFASHFPERLRLGASDRPLRHGMPNVWSLAPIGLTAQSVARPTVRLLADLGRFNLVQAGAYFWCLRKDLGPVDPLRFEPRDHPPTMFFGRSPEEAKGKLPA